MQCVCLSQNGGTGIQGLVRELLEPLCSAGLFLEGTAKRRGVIGGEVWITELLSGNRRLARGELQSCIRKGRQGLSNLPLTIRGKTGTRYEDPLLGGVDVYRHLFTHVGSDCVEGGKHTKFFFRPYFRGDGNHLSKLAGRGSTRRRYAEKLAGFFDADFVLLLEAKCTLNGNQRVGAQSKSSGAKFTCCGFGLDTVEPIV